MAKQNNTKVVTGIVRLSYANIWDPKAPVSGGDPRSGCSGLWRGGELGVF